MHGCGGRGPSGHGLESCLRTWAPGGRSAASAKRPCASHFPGPDLVLMDIRLKGRIDGIEPPTDQPGAWHIPIVYLTPIPTTRPGTGPVHGALPASSSSPRRKTLKAVIQMTLYRSVMQIQGARGRITWTTCSTASARGGAGSGHEGGSHFLQPGGGEAAVLGPGQAPRADPGAGDAAPRRAGGPSRLARLADPAGWKAAGPERLRVRNGRRTTG